MKVVYLKKHLLIFIFLTGCLARCSDAYAHGTDNTSFYHNAYDSIENNSHQSPQESIYKYAELFNRLEQDGSLEEESKIELAEKIYAKLNNLISSELVKITSSKQDQAYRNKLFNILDKTTSSYGALTNLLRENIVWRFIKRYRKVIAISAIAWTAVSLFKEARRNVDLSKTISEAREDVLSSPTWQQFVEIKSLCEKHQEYLSSFLSDEEKNYLNDILGDLESLKHRNLTLPGHLNQEKITRLQALLPNITSAIKSLDSTARTCQELGLEKGLAKKILRLIRSLNDESVSLEQFNEDLGYLITLPSKRGSLLIPLALVEDAISTHANHAELFQSKAAVFKEKASAIKKNEFLVDAPHYKTLGISEKEQSGWKSEEGLTNLLRLIATIKVGFRQTMLTKHPDRGAKDTEEAQEVTAAHTYFQEKFGLLAFNKAVIPSLSNDAHPSNPTTLNASESNVDQPD